MEAAKHMPMQQIGFTVRLNSGGGFDLRGCPEPEALASTIVRAVNAHDLLITALRTIVSLADGPGRQVFADVAIEALNAVEAA